MTEKHLMDLSGLSKEAVEELHRQGQACLEGTVTLAIAADARATTLVGIFGGAALALLAACATILAGPSSQQYHAMLVSAGVAVVSLFAAALCCAWASRPANFHIPGYEPKRLCVSAADVTWMLRYSIMDIQSRIDDNRAALELSARLVAIGMLLAMSGVLIASIAYFIV